jgi:hypothetical protein
MAAQALLGAAVLTGAHKHAQAEGRQVQLIITDPRSATS